MTKLELLKTYYGYDSFRPGQEPIIDALLAGRDVLNVMPTGGGKSLCYQIPAMLLPGITLVVSPLVSLMRDQVTQLVQMGIPAAFLNSSLTFRQYQLALSRAKDGWYRIIYVAPERLNTPAFQEFVQSASISLLAVDEAHCISQWGQDFRPAYLTIPDFLASLPQRPPVGAFTATATPKVREDIQRLLKLEQPLEQVTGFDRANLYFEVRHPSSRPAELLSVIREHPGECGIVYCSTRKNVEEVCDALCAAGLDATRYHAGLEPEERRKNQEDFLFDRRRIMVATNAFGMGIDKSDVRYVVHYNMPKDLESYYQEAGRAGRDGAAASCILLYSGQDVRTAQYLIDHSQPAEGVSPETAAQLRQRDLERLKQMTFYCRCRGCLRQFLLSYFGEHAPANCGNCWNCLHNFEERDIGPEARRILRCVSDTGEHYGITLIAAILCGGRDERILRYRLNEEGTYCVLSHLTQQEVQDRIRFLVDEGYLLLTEGSYPTLRLTDKAVAILRTDPSSLPAIRMKVVIPSEKRRPVFEKLDARQSQLFDQLKELRTKLARQQGVPAFVVFSDQTLRDMAFRQPRTQQELLGVSGVGVRKAEQYGGAFLSLIQKFSEASE